MVTLEEIRSQNRATIEAVEAHHQGIRKELHEFRTEARADVRMLQAGIQNHSAEVRQIKTDVAALKEHLSRLDAVITADYRERLNRLEARVEALERH